jgi:hypothetical protein
MALPDSVSTLVSVLVAVLVLVSPASVLVSLSLGQPSLTGRCNF